MRDIVMFGMVLVLLVLSFRNAFGVYVLWGWSGLIGLAGKMYGFMQSLQIVMLFALIALVQVLLRRDPKMGAFKFTGLHLLFLLFALQALISATFAFSGLARNWEIAGDLFKTLLYCSLMSILVTSRFRSYVIVVFIVLAMAYYGMIEGLRFIASGGAHISQGDARLGDNNHFAVVVGSSIPLMLYLFLYAKAKPMRLVMLGLMLLTTLAVVTTYSRGGMLTLAGMGFLLILRSRKKVLGFAMVGVLAVTVVAVAPDAWVDRMGSIKTADNDSSFMGRVKAWKRSSAIALDHPFTGGGFQSVQNHAVYEKYRYEQGLLGFIETGVQTYAAAAHSIYFEVMGDMGFVGLFIFLCIMSSPFVFLSRAKKLSRRIGPSSQWGVDLLTMISIGHFGYLVGGASISAAYFEMAYLYVSLAGAVVAILEVEARRSMEQQSPLMRPSAVV